jgi:hypothetical protein
MMRPPFATGPRFDAGLPMGQQVGPYIWWPTTGTVRRDSRTIGRLKLAGESWRWHVVTDADECRQFAALNGFPSPASVVGQVER